MCKTFADRLQMLMDERGWTQADLARETGINTSNIAYLVNGKTKDPRLQTLLLLADAFGVSLDYLTGYRVNYTVVKIDEDDGR